jgi:sugar phosphate isomerase/epimerase
MDFGISTRCFGTTPLSPQLLDRLPRAEVGRVELHAALPGFDYRNRSVLRDIARWFRDNELAPPSLHLPFEEDVVAARHIDRQRALDDLKRCLELGDLLPLPHAVLHVGARHQEFNPVFFEYVYMAIAVIQSFSGVRVLFETLDNSIATFDRITEFKVAAQIPTIGICYDTGHGEIEGIPDAVHLNDNDGSNDDHLWPFKGKRDWPALVASFVSSSYEGPLILEGSDERFDLAISAKSRLEDLWAEARSSIEEFRLKYKLPQPKTEEEE